MSLDWIILKKHRLLTFNDLYDDNCFACYKTKKEDICVLVLLPDGNEVQSKTYIFINWELEEIPTPCYFSRVVFFGNFLIACQWNENGFYIFQTHKKIWIPFPQFTLAFISPIWKNLKISKYECKWMGENILFHKPTKLNTEEHESFPENISTTETLFSLNEKKKYWKIYSTKENKYLTLKNKITKCYSPLNFWDCGIFCKEIPHALETINYNLDIISIPMINSKTLANLRWKALPICY